MSAIKFHVAAIYQKEEWMNKSLLFLQVIFLHLNKSVNCLSHKSRQPYIPVHRDDSIRMIIREISSAKSWTRLSDFTSTFSLSCIGEGNGNPLQCSCLENPRGRRAWWADVYGVTESRTRLKWLSSSSSKDFTPCHLINIPEHLQFAKHFYGAFLMAQK